MLTVGTIRTCGTINKPTLKEFTDSPSPQHRGNPHKKKAAQRGVAAKLPQSRTTLLFTWSECLNRGEEVRNLSRKGKKIQFGTGQLKERREGIVVVVVVVPHLSARSLAAAFPFLGSATPASPFSRDAAPERPTRDGARDPRTHFYHFPNFERGNDPAYISPSPSLSLSLSSLTTSWRHANLDGRVTPSEPYLLHRNVQYIRASLQRFLFLC